MYLLEILITGAIAGSVVWWFLSLLDEWLKDRRAIKELDRGFKEFCKYYNYDERSQRWVKNDGLLNRSEDQKRNPRRNSNIRYARH
jgi:hypothetical protein